MMELDTIQHSNDRHLLLSYTILSHTITQIKTQKAVRQYTFFHQKPHEPLLPSLPPALHKRSSHEEKPLTYFADPNFYSLNKNIPCGRNSTTSSDALLSFQFHILNRFLRYIHTYTAAFLLLTKNMALAK